MKTEAVGSSETSQITFLIWHGKPKNPPHLNMYLLAMSVHSAWLLAVLFTKRYLYYGVGTLSPSRSCFSRVYSKHCTYNRYITQTTHIQTYRTVTYEYTLTQTRNIVNILKEFLFCMYISKCLPSPSVWNTCSRIARVQQPVPWGGYLANATYLSLSLQPFLMDYEIPGNKERLWWKHRPGGRDSGYE